MKSKNCRPIPPRLKRRPAVLASSIAALAALCLAPRPALAQTWTPLAFTDWNTAANWTPNGVPNGPGTSVTIGVTNLTLINLSADTEVGSITFTINAFPESLMTDFSAFTISGAGITNNSVYIQNFITGAGINGLGGSIHFVNSATAGSSTEFTANGATAANPAAGTISFTDTSTAGSATLVNNGGNAAGIAGGLIQFSSAASVGSATIITNGGINGGAGSTTLVSGSGANGTTSTIITNGNGTFDISGRTNGSLTVGSIAGSGNYFLGANQLITGGNNTSTTVFGIIADGGQSGGSGGSLVKNGTGTLILSGANTYTGATTANAGTLQLGTSATAGSISTASVITVLGTLSVVNTGGSLANTINNSGVTNFSLSATAGSANITNQVNGSSGGTINFSGASTGGQATINNVGSGVASGVGASTNFSGNATAGTANIIAQGGTVNGAGGGQILFQDTSSAGSAHLLANSGSVGGLGGTILFQGSADGGTATAVINAGATFDISGLTSGGMKIGTISGAGTFNLGGNTLTVGRRGLITDSSLNTTVSGLIEGTGSLAKSGVGSLTLTAQNTYTGTTSIINGGTINANVAGALPSLAADGGNSSARAALSMDQTGTGGSTLNLGANQAVSSLNGAASSTVNLKGNVLTVGAMLGAASTFAGVISDTALSSGLTVDGNGVLNLTGNNTYAGQTTVNGTSSLVVGNQSTGNLTGTSGVSVANGATLLLSLGSGSVFRPNVVLNGSGASLLMTEVGTNTVSGVISGAGSLAQDASGTTILTGANTYSGGTFVNAGTLQLGTATAAASISTNPVAVHDRSTLSLVNVAGGTFANDVSNGQSGVGTVSINSATTITLFGALRDGGGQLALTKNGPGTAIISGSNNHYTGTTTVNGGILEVDGSLGQTTITVNKNAALSGDGIAGNDVNIETGGSLETGGGASTGVRTIVVGNLVLNTGANTIFRLGAPGTSDFVDTGGTLALGGNLIVVPLAGFGAGTYSLFGFGIGVSKSFIVSAIPGYTTATTTVGNTVNLIVTAATGTLAEQNWNSIGNGMSNGGSGTWNTTAVNWSDPSSNGTTHWLGGTADFGVTGGTVTIPAATTISAQGLIFDVDGYSLNGTNPTTSALSLTGKATITVNTGTATLNTKVTGSAGLLANGPGTLILANTANAITGKVSVVTGTLQIGTLANNGSIGTAAVTLNNGATLTVLNALNNTLPNAISAGLGQTGTVNIASVNALTITGALTDGAPGQLGLTLSGTATTILTNSKNTFSGATTIGANTLQIGTSTVAGSLGAGSPVIFNGSGTLSLVNVAGNVFANNVTVSTNVGGIVEVSSTANLTLSGVLADGQSVGTLLLFKSGSGTTTLTGNNSYSYTEIDAGTLQLGDGTTVQMRVSRPGNPVQVEGAATLVTNFASGATFGGSVALNTTTSVFNAGQTGTNTLSGVISGSGTVTQKGTGRTILTTDETYTGATTVSAGVLQAGDGRSGNLTGPGLVTVSGTGILALDLADKSTFIPSVMLTAPANQLQAIQTGFTRITGTISGAGVLDQNGPGTTELTSAETYTGGTNVNAGTLVVDTSLAAGPVNVKGGTLEVDGTLAAGSTAAVTVNTGGMLTGSGTIGSKVSLTGGGTITFSTSSAVINGTLGITGGTWSGLGQVNGAVTSSSGVFTLNGSLTAPAGVTVNGGTLAGTGTLFGSLNDTSSANSTFAGVIANHASPSSVTMNKTGATLTLTGANTYTGPTTVSAGTLQIGDGSTSNTSLGNTAITVSGTGVLATNLTGTAIFHPNVTLSGTGATLQALPGPGTTSTLSGLISGTGALNQSGAGTTILNNADTYTGPTKVAAGTLEVDGSLAAASTVNVGTAGTLTGTGTINGNVTLTGNGTINLSIGAVINGTVAITGGNWNGYASVLGAITSSSGTFNLNGTLFETQYPFPGLTISGGTLAGTGKLAGDLIYKSSQSSTFAGFVENGSAGGSLTMNSAAATLTLTGIGEYGGLTKVIAGTLQIGNGVSGNLAYLVSGARQGEVDVSGTGVLALDLKTMDSFPTPVVLTSTGSSLKAIEGLNGQQTISAFISGAGMFDQNGLGTTIITNDDAYTGPTNVNAGILDIEGSLAAESTVHVGTAGTLEGNGGTNGNATLTGTGVIAFSGSNSGIGGTLAVTGGQWNGQGIVLGLVTSSSGTFTIGTGATLTASAGVNVTGGTLAAANGTATLAGNLNDTSSSSFTFAGIIADHASPSSVTMNKTGATLTLAGANTYTGPTTVSAGTLQIGDGTNGSLSTTAITVAGTGVLATDLPNNATFSQNVALSATGATLKPIQSGTNTLSGLISGAGGLNQAGPGRTILTHAETYTGATTVSAGVLQVDNALAAASAVNVNGSGTLAGIGTILGPVSIATGGTVSPGDAGGPGTLTVSKLVLGPGANSNFRLDTSGTQGAGVNDLVSVAGNLTIAGNLNVTQLTHFGGGGYVLATYTGTLTNTGFTNINGIGGFAASISTFPGQVILVVTGPAVTQYWDGAGTIPDSVVGGGSGMWKSTTSNWTDSTGTANTSWQAGNAVFNGTPGTVTIAAPVSAQNLTFNVSGYTLTGTSPLNLVGSTTMVPTINVTGGATTTIGAPLTGIAGLNANGGGTLILTNPANTYTGGTQVSATNGTLQVGTASTAGSLGSGTVSISNFATLDLVNVHGNVLPNNVTSGAGSVGFLIVNSTLATTLSGTLTDGAGGNLGLAQKGTGTTIVTNAGNTFTGGVNINKGTLQVGATTTAGSLGAASNPVSIANGATLSLVNVSGNIFGNSVSNPFSGTGTVSVNSAAQNTLSGVISNGSGTLALTQSGTGTTILTGANTYTGPTTVTAGTFQIGDGTNGSLATTTPVIINSAGTFATNLPNAATLSNPVTDNGHFVASGAGSNSYTLSSTITGTGNLTKNGAGEAILTGANTYKGGTVVNGSLAVQNTTGSATGTGAVTVNNGGGLAGGGTISGPVTLNSGGLIEPSAGVAAPGTTLHTGALTWNGGGTITLQLGAGGVADALALSGALTKGAAGSYTLDLLNTAVTTTPATYTLLTFTSTNFLLSNFNLELPGGVSGTLVETSTSLKLTMAHNEEPAGGAATPSLPLPGGGTSADLPSSLSLTATPEPTSAALLAFGGAALLGYRRRQHKK